MNNNGHNDDVHIDDKVNKKRHNFAHHTYISRYECEFRHFCLRIQTQIDSLENGVKDVDSIIVEVVHATPFLQSKNPLTALEISKSKEHWMCVAYGIQIKTKPRQNPISTIC